MNNVPIALGLGSNVGDRAGFLQRALARLVPQVTVTSLSSLYETAPWGMTEQPNFYNIALIGHTTLSPLAVLAHLKGIEQALGRQARTRYGPREIDIDILLYGDSVVDHTLLQVPHPFLHERRFVLQPLAEIAPDWSHPQLRQTIADLLAALPDSNGVVRVGDWSAF